MSAAAALAGTSPGCVECGEFVPTCAECLRVRAHGFADGERDYQLHPQRAMLLPALGGPDSKDIERGAPAINASWVEVDVWLRELGRRVRQGELAIEQALLAVWFRAERRGELRFADQGLRALLLKGDAVSRQGGSGRPR